MNLKREIAEISLKHGGSITACHGATRAGDAELLPTEMGSAWPVVKAIKRTLDPNNIMNPNPGSRLKPASAASRLTPMAAEPGMLPRAVRKGPPITVRCECGEKRDLRYGERWQCEGCGRSYDTNRIPVEEYASLRRDRVHDRILPTAIFVILGCLVLVFVLVGRPLAAVLIVPMVGFFWGTFVRPKRRRRQYKAIAERPRWKISAD